MNGINLDGKKLGDADLKSVELNGAHLVGTNLTDADLENAKLICAQASGASFGGAVLKGADLSGANFANAGFDYTDLQGAVLRGTEMKGASLFEADVRDAIFEPRSVRQIKDIANARNLESLRYGDDPTALVELRQHFRSDGYREQERKITFALNRREAELDPFLERWFKTLAFNLTCRYGMSPGRTLRIWFVLWVVCSLAYTQFIHQSGKTSGIYRVKKHRWRDKEIVEEKQIRFDRLRRLDRGRLDVRSRYYREWQVFRVAAFFSLMNGFNIGFREVEFGKWLRMLTRREYDLKATGWARTVAGFQSLLSLYMIALWALTYFGRPFD